MHVYLQQICRIYIRLVVLVVFTHTWIYLNYLANLALPNLQVPAIWRLDHVGGSLKLDDLRFVLESVLQRKSVCWFYPHMYIFGWLTLILRYFEPFQPSASILENRKEKEANHLMVKQKKQKKARESSTCHLLHTSVWDIPIQFNTINRSLFTKMCFIARLAQTLDCQVVRNVKRRRLANRLWLSLRIGHHKWFKRILLHQCAVFRNSSCRWQGRRSRRQGRRRRSKRRGRRRRGRWRWRKRWKERRQGMQDMQL